MRDGAIQEQLIRSRWPVLGLTVAGWFATQVAPFFAAIGPLIEIETGVFAIAAILAAYWLLRNWWVAAAIAVTATIALTLPPFLASPGIAILEKQNLDLRAAIELWAQPDASVTQVMAATVLGLSLWLGYGFVGEIARGSNPDAAAFGAMRSIRASAVMIFVALTLASWSFLEIHHDLRGSTAHAAAVMTTGALAAGFLCLVFLPLVLGAITLDENMISRFNRISERRARWLGHLVFAAQPRWASSLLGICVVLLTIVAFDHNPVAPTSPLVSLWHRPGVPAAICLAVVGLTGAIGLRDWRAFCASALPPAFAVTLGAWIAYRTGLTVLDAPFTDYIYFRAWQLVALGAVAGAACSFAMAARISVYRKLDLPLAEACEGTLGTVGPPMIATCSVVAILTIPGPVPPIAILDGVAALLLTPAIFAALETIVPRRRITERLYGKKKVGPS